MLVLLVEAEVRCTLKVWLGSIVPAVLVNVPPFIEYSLSPPETLTVNELVKPLNVTVSDCTMVLKATSVFIAKVNAVGAVAVEPELSGNHSTSPHPARPATIIGMNNNFSIPRFSTIVFSICWVFS